MSVQDCMVCDQCGKHSERPSAWTRTHFPLPVGWWTFCPADQSITWLTFCGPECVTNYILKEQAR